MALLMAVCNVIYPTVAAAAEHGKAIVIATFINNAKTTYDDQITKKITPWLHTKVDDIYDVQPDDQIVAKMTEMGLTSIISAERSELISLLGGNSVDYLVVAEMQPFIRKEKITVFTYGKDMTATMYLKIIDVPNNKYLYNGKFIVKASDSTMDWLIGNKSVAMMAIDKVLIEMGEVISVRLPLEPSIKK